VTSPSCGVYFTSALKELIYFIFNNIFFIHIFIFLAGIGENITTGIQILQYFEEGGGISADNINLLDEGIEHIQRLDLRKHLNGYKDKHNALFLRDKSVKPRPRSAYEDVNVGNRHGKSLFFLFSLFFQQFNLLLKTHKVMK